MTPITCKQMRADTMAADPDYFYYRGGQLVNILQGQGQSQPGQRFFQTATGLAAQINVGGNAGTWLIGTDALGSVLGGSDGTNPEEHCYAPYGGEKQQGATERVMKLGYTGAYRDPLTGLYPLGNGYRCYLPELMCFNKADFLSPFGAGGINTRSYCEGDPINCSDPSGHAKQSWAYGGILSGLVGIVGAIFTGGALAIPEALFGVAAVVTGVTSAALPDEDEQAKDILGYLSSGLGFASGLFGGASKVTEKLAVHRGELVANVAVSASTDGIVEMRNAPTIRSALKTISEKRDKALMENLKELNIRGVDQIAANYENLVGFDINKFLMASQEEQEKTVSEISFLLKYEYQGRMWRMRGGGGPQAQDPLREWHELEIARQKEEKALIAKYAGSESSTFLSDIQNGFNILWNRRLQERNFRPLAGPLELPTVHASAPERVWYDAGNVVVMNLLK